MAAATPSVQTRETLRGDLFGGLTAAVIALPLAIAFGVAALTPLGPRYAAMGALVGLLGAIFTGFFASLLGGTPAQVTGPTAPMTVVITSFLAESVRVHGTERAGLVLLMMGAAIVVGGLGQIAIGLSGGGKIVKYIPYPVVAGFMNGIAVLIFLGQLRPFLGVGEQWSRFALGDAWIPLSVGTLTVLAVVVTKRLSRTIPASLVGLFVGVGAYLALGLAKLAPLSTEHNDLLVGAVPNPLASFDQLRAIIPIFNLGSLDALSLTDLQRVATTGGTLAVLGSIDSLLTSVVADQVTGTRHDARKELFGQGIGNVASGLLGGLAGAGATVRTLVNIDAGGRSRRSGMIHAVAILLVVLVLSSPAGWIPKSALAGILFVTAFGMLDQYSLGLVRKSLVRYEFAIIVLVAIVTVVVDLMIAVGIGVAIAGALFVWEQTRKPAVRRRFTGDELLSRRIRRPEEAALLAKHGARTVAYELSGSLFFGTTDRFVSEVERDLPNVDRLVLDFSKVEDMDLSGVRVLSTVVQRLVGMGKAVAVSGLADLERRSPRVSGLLDQLKVLDLVGAPLRHPTLDHALEHFEQTVLDTYTSLSAGSAPIPLSQCDGFVELDPADLSRFERRLGASQRAAPGQVLAKEGSAADALYVVQRGCVSVVHPDKQAGRLASLGPGSVWGVRTLLEGERWVHQLRADTEVEYSLLTRIDLEALRDEAPSAVAHLERALLHSMLERQDLLASQLARLEEA